MKRIVVVGAGAAGLSFAYYLSASSHDPFHCILVDPDTKEENDRTWAFWGESFDFDHLVSHRWSRLSLNNRVGVKTESGGYRYIPADRFYRHCRRRLEEDERFEFLRERVERIEEVDGAVQVILAPTPGMAASLDPPRSIGSGRRRIEADIAVESVFGPPERGECLLRQSFVGWEVQAKEPYWNPDEATLMDFEVAHGRHVLEFYYVLPMSSRRALIEFTAVDALVPGADYLEERVESYLDSLLGRGGWEILRREKGTIPLYESTAPRRRGRVYHLGVAAGAARPSTGYAFRSIIETSAALAERFASHLRGDGSQPPEVPGVPHAAWRPRFFDAVFLELLRGEAHVLPEALMALFRRNEAARVFRFLAGRSSLRDELAIVASLPWTPFLRSLGRLLRGYLPAPAGLFQRSKEKAYELS